MSTRSSSRSGSRAKAKTPSLGQIVRVHLEGVTVPAIVTAVHEDETVNVRLFSDADPQHGPLRHAEWQSEIPHEDTADDKYEGPTWSWPDA
jgi:hypothetical protein